MNRQIYTLSLVITILTLSSMSYSVAQCVIPPSGLVSWWPGDGNALDIQSSNDGTLQNGATFAAGFVTSGNGQAFSFDGGNDFVEIPNSASLNVQTGDFSVDAWFKIDGGNSGYIVSKDSCGTSGIWNIFAGGGGITFRTVGASGSEIISSPPVSVGDWHHVVAVKDGTTMLLYLDGVFVSSGTQDSMATTVFPVRIGTRGGSITNPGGCGDVFFSGEIDEVEIYNRALNPSEIQAIFDADSAGKCKSPLEPKLNQIERKIIENALVTEAIFPLMATPKTVDPQGLFEEVEAIVEKSIANFSELGLNVQNALEKFNEGQDLAAQLRFGAAVKKFSEAMRELINLNSG